MWLLLSGNTVIATRESKSDMESLLDASRAEDLKVRWTLDKNVKLGDTYELRK